MGTKTRGENTAGWGGGQSKKAGSTALGASAIRRVASPFPLQGEQPPPEGGTANGVGSGSEYRLQAVLQGAPIRKGAWQPLLPMRSVAARDVSTRWSARPAHGSPRDCGAGPVSGQGPNVARNPPFFHGVGNRWFENEPRLNASKVAEPERFAGRRRGRGNPRRRPAGGGFRVWPWHGRSGRAVGRGCPRPRSR